MFNLDEFEKQAKKILPTTIYDYYSSGSCDEISLRKNRQSYDDISLIPRVLTDISSRTISTLFFNESITFPALIAPTSFHGMAHSQGELATAHAAKNAGTIFIASTMSNNSIESIGEVCPQKLWFQLYILNDKAATLDLIRRAENSNVKVLVVTVDSQVLGIREKDLQNNFHLPKHLVISNLIQYQTFQQDNSQLEIKAKSQNLFDKKLTWKDIEWIRSNTKLPILLKGILHRDDAQISLKAGVDGIIVSNHGGRQLDTSITPIHALPAIAEEVSNKITILVDGGVRRGTDIIKALALGADGVLIGRPVIWGLASNGAQGVEEVFDILRNEFSTAMALCGFSSINDLKQRGRDIIYWTKK